MSKSYILMKLEYLEKELEKEKEAAGWRDREMKIEYRNEIKDLKRRVCQLEEAHSKKKNKK